MYHHHNSSSGYDNDKSTTPIPIGGGNNSKSPSSSSLKSSPPTFSSSPNTSTFHSISKNQASAVPSTLVFTRNSSTVSPSSPISASYSGASGQVHFQSSNLTSNVTSERKTTMFHFGRKKSVLKATPIISPLLLPTPDQSNNSFSLGSNNALTSTSSGMSSQGSTGNLESVGQSLLENSTMATFASWEEVNGSMLNSFDSFSSVSSNSGSFDSNYEESSEPSKRSSVGKSRKFTTFISKIFGKNQENAIQSTSPKSNRSKAKFLNSLSETDDFFRDSAMGIEPSPSPSTSSGSLKGHHAASNSLDQQDRSFTDLDTKQKSMFNGWFQEKASILEDLFDKEGCVYFYKNQIKPGQNKKRSSTTLNLSSNSSSSNEGNDDDGNGDLSREEDVFVERFFSCKNSAITIFEKGTKDSPVKHSFSWNQNVTFSLVPTEKSFDTVVAKSIKKATRYNRSQYFLFEIRVEQGDNFYVMDPLILVGLVRTKEERDDWADLFEIYSIYSSLNVLTEDDFTLSSTMTREETLRDYFIQEYELFDEYQNEVREQGENQQNFNNRGETVMDPRLSTIENPFEETNAFQREMEKSYTFLIQSFDPYLAINSQSQ